MKKLGKLFSKAFCEQLWIVVRYGDKHYPSMLMWNHWVSYVGADNKTYYDNKGVLKSWFNNK